MKDIKSAGGERASPEGFITLHGFMMKGMGLSGVPLLVFARIYGFNSAGLDFYESKPHLAGSVPEVGVTTRFRRTGGARPRKAGIV